jgi:hypothetical protein
MTLAPALVITCAFAIASVPWPPAATALGVVALLAAGFLQPSRLDASKSFFRYPQYGALLAGSRTAARQAPVVHSMRAGFEVHETTDVSYMYRLLGGRVADTGPFDAIIQSDGTVTFAPATRP